MRKLAGKIITITYILILSLFVSGSLFAQSDYDFPNGNYWSFDAGVGMSGVMVHGASIQLIADPKLWLSPWLMVGSRAGVNISTDQIVTFEGQVYLRWNFLHFGRPENRVNVFVQGGLGLLAAYRGWNNPFDDVHRTRGSIMFDAAAGVTIPLTQRWHIEASVRGGYPHIAGFSVTAGYKFPLPRTTYFTETVTIQEQVQVQTEIQTETEVDESVSIVPITEIARRMVIMGVEYVIFGPDSGSFNVGVDADARQLNTLVMDFTAQTLRDHPSYFVRLEGHANPFISDVADVDEMMALSSLRANAIADQLRARGVSEEQLVVVALGGTRAATSEWEARNRNRRVELIIMSIEDE